VDLSRLVKIGLVVASSGALGLAAFLFRSKWRQMLASIISVLLTLLFAEVFLARVQPQIMEHDLFFEPDPQLGWRFIPGITGTFAWMDVAPRRIRINSLGFRDPPRDLVKERPRVLVLGDSFVSNLAVDEGDVFTRQMEEMLPGTEVWNLGVNGYGQVQEYLLLREWLPVLQPDLVVVLVYMRNDFTDNTGIGWLYPRPTAAWTGPESSLEIIPPRQDVSGQHRRNEPWWAFYRKSHLYHLFDRRIGLMVARYLHRRHPGGQPSRGTPPELYLCRLDPVENTQNMFRTMEEMLTRISAFCQDQGVPLMFVLAPSFVQVEVEAWMAMLKTYGCAPEEYDRALPHTRLMQFAGERGLRMLNLLPLLEAEFQKAGVLYHHEEQHWNARGNQVVAAALCAFLKETGWVKD
jgi:hypothetical protein